MPVNSMHEAVKKVAQYRRLSENYLSREALLTPFEIGEFWVVFARDGDKRYYVDPVTGQAYTQQEFKVLLEENLAYKQRDADIQLEIDTTWVQHGLID